MITGFILLILTGLSSCKKFLDTKPTDVYTPVNYYSSEAQLQQALNSAYAGLMNSSLYAQVASFNFMASNDELLSNRTSDGDARGLRFNFDATLPHVNSIWKQCYIGITGVNNLLDNIQKPQMDEGKRNIIKGQALFLRGYYYFILTSYFGNVPVLLHMPAISEVNIPAAPQADIYAQIEKDMKEAEILLANFTSDNVVTSEVVTLDAVQAVLARVYLYWAGYPLNNTSKYQEVITYTDKVINSGRHFLNPDYRQLFANLAQDRYDKKEMIWELGSYSAAAGTIVKGGNDIGNFIGINSNYIAADTSSYASAGWVYITLGLFNAYETDPASTSTPKSSIDIRREWNCANYNYSGNPRKKNIRRNPWQMYSGKFRRELCPLASRAAGIYGINWPVIRYADVLLMKAEAENYVNGATAAAYSAINEVRKRGYGLMNGNVIESIVVSSQGSGYTVAPLITITGGGGSGASATAQITSGKVTGIYVNSPGSGTTGTGFTSAPTITIGTDWVANSNFTTGMQINNAGNLYTVTAAGTTTATPPTHTSGSSSAAVTGAVFTYAGKVATATATITAGNEYELSPGLSKTDFQLAIRDERLRELNAEGLRRFDLIRWGNYVADMQSYATWAAANGISVSSTGNPNGLVGLQNIGPKHILLPIPVSELSLNHSLVQNPGW